jgi:hypothetical protein
MKKPLSLALLATLILACAARYDEEECHSCHAGCEQDHLSTGDCDPECCRACSNGCNSC